MKRTLEILVIGSTGPQRASKDSQQPQLKATTVRRIQGSTPWFEPDTDLQRAALEFRTGIIIAPTFNPRAKVMKDVFCGTDRLSEAEITGIVVPLTDNLKMPSDAGRTC